MSGCKSFGAELGAYLDGELEPGTRSALEAHLPSCDACRFTLDSQRRLEEALRALPRAEPSPQFEARFWARLARAEEEQSGWWSRLPGWRSSRARLGWALGGAVLAVLLLLLLPRQPSLPEGDWELVADEEEFELVTSGDLELIASLEVLEAWDAAGEI